MADEDRAETHALSLFEELAREPFRFGFFPTLRFLECAFRDKPRVGSSVRLADDPIRLAQEPSLAFAPATLSTFEPGSEDAAPRLSVFFLGLFGPNGPLPLHLTEYARSRQRNSDDPTFARFADVFHHRMLSLFYKAWAISQPTVSLDRPEEDRFGTYVASLIGLGMRELRDRDALPDHAKLHFAGHLSCQTKHRSGLRSFLRAFFEIPVDIEPFIGQWLRLPHRNRCRLGESRATGVLGETLIVGSHIWDCQQRFRIFMGPMGIEEYRGFLPGSEEGSIERLIAAVRNYLGDELAWDVRLILRKEEVPPLRLGEMAQLGWTTWLTGKPFEHDADDLVLEPLPNPD